jgi:hypothetical protein
MNTIPKWFLSSSGVLSILFTQAAYGLPAYARLFQSKYAYRTSCTLCHTAGGGSAVTEYGRDFLRAGGNYSAFAKIEKRDSDGDGTANLAEILGKSNPGDARSLQGKLGDWLDDANKVSVPDKDLKKLFPTAEAFSALEGSLKDTQVAALESQLGKKLTDEDKLPTFYFALQGGKKNAVAQFVSVPSPKGPVPIAVAMDISGNITSVRVLKNPGDKAIEADSFLSQFVGKTKAAPLEVGKDIKAANANESLSTEVSLAVKKAVLMINSVFGK